MSTRMKIAYDSIRSQCTLLLLAGLDELGGTGTWRELLEHIAARNYFNLEAEDNLPIPTALEPVPRWELLMGLARATSAEGGCIAETEDGQWQLTGDGKRFYTRAAAQFRDGIFGAHRCFLWTEEFKKRLVPAYARHPEERSRPAGLYHDILRQLTVLTTA